MKRKFKIMTRQIEQLKEEIQQRDAALVKEHFEHMKVGQEEAPLARSMKRPLSPALPRVTSASA
eukprot:3247515-Pleurochrysis_carterae.AAC.2